VDVELIEISVLPEQAVLRAPDAIPADAAPRPLKRFACLDRSAHLQSGDGVAGLEISGAEHGAASGLADRSEQGLCHEDCWPILETKAPSGLNRSAADARSARLSWAKGIPQLQ